MASAARLALDEITLVLFTTLAPAAMLACATVALLVGFARMGEAPRTRLAHALVVPLLGAMVGLVASATHLGTPSNALYVVCGVGRSPLSNEVACAVAFLALGGLFWLYSFALRPRRALQRAWSVLVCAAGVAAVGGISVAYAAPTALTWASWHVPANLCLSAVAGCPLLVAATLRIARADAGTWPVRALHVMGVVALAVNLICLTVQWEWLGTVGNAVGAARDLVPCYPVMIAAYGVCAAVAYVLSASAVRVHERTARPMPAGRLALACALFYLGLFGVRFGFYMMHMTVGVSL